MLRPNGMFNIQIGPQGDRPVKFDGGPGYYVQVYAMDSAFVHARALLEFLTGRTDPVATWGPIRLG